MTFIPTPALKILLLAGTGEARILARRLTEKGHEVTASFSGATRRHAELECETRVGGFGGDAGFTEWIRRQKPDLVLDATHPFAWYISKRTWRICQAENYAYVQVLRKEWTPKTSDNWIFIQKEAEVADHVAAGDTLFLATGRQSLDQFRGLDHCTIYCRQIDPPDQPFPFPNGSFVIGRPPFSVENEINLFKRLAIDSLIVKNAGGDASRTKLDAANILGLKVIMINRPKQSDVPVVSDVEGAIAWIDAYAHH